MIGTSGGISPAKTPKPTRRGPRKIYLIGFVIAALGFIVTSLPIGIMGQDAGGEDILGRLRALERKMLRVAGMAEYKLPAKVTLCGVEVPINRPDVREALEFEFYSILGDRGTLILRMKRSGRYFPYIEKRLRERKMPDDLKYLAVAESDLKLLAYSPVGAAGIWQFMEGTGKHYGLRFDSTIDERRDFEKSTNAALEFLSDLNNQFNDWTLSMAAYNAGPGRIGGQLAEQKVKSYFDLNLVRETERYVFRIAAFKIIMGNPQEYGLDLAPEEKYSPDDWETVTISITTPNIDLREIADLAGTSYKQVVEINPQFRQDGLPRGSHIIHLPKGTSLNFITAWNEKHKITAEPEPETTTPQPKQTKKITYIVKRGDTLMSISRKHGCSVDDIRKWNKLDQKASLPAGKKLIIIKK